MSRIDTSSCLICSLLVALASMLGVDRVRAQTDDGSTSGAPLRANVSTIRSFETVPAASPGIRLRYDAFEAEFARDFGFRLISDDAENSGGNQVFQRLHRRLETQWGGTSIYGWIERCVALYMQIDAMTNTQHAGFDMSLEVDDMTEGRVGLQMSRQLD